MSKTKIQIDTQSQSFAIPAAMCLVVIIIGCLLRFFEITHNSFIFYDEGMYLQHNRELLLKIEQFPAKDGNEFLAIIRILFLTALATAKWLWFFISNLRVFFDGQDMFYFNRIIGALSGVVTVGLTYVFARRMFRSNAIALLSAAILAVLPGHVFYSRLAMQESFSTMCFLIGVFCYYQRRHVSFFLVFSAVFFSAVYFTNYRMIILPILLGGFEFIQSLAEKRAFDWKKYGLTVLVFFIIVIGIGLINNASNLSITTAWMGHQAGMASAGFQPLNLLSYPYTIFRLEGYLLGLLLMVSCYWLLIRDWQKFLPAAMVLIQIFIFTFASEKGARYLCVILPFIAMSVALNVHVLILQNTRFKSWAAHILLALLMISLTAKSFEIVDTPRGYKQAVEFIHSKDPGAKILSTQPLVMGLWTPLESDVLPVPKNVPELIERFAQGYRYLVIDPQVFVSWTASGQRFTLPLVDYMGFMYEHLQFQQKFSHLNNALLERFVLDHNEYLMNSIRFLKRKDADYGAVYVYDLQYVLEVLQKVMESTANKSGAL